MTLIQVKRGSAASWSNTNPILSPGEFGYETDTFKFKIGNGNQHWNDLPYVPFSAGDLGLGSVNNTSDADKPVSTATQTALDGKANTNHMHSTGQVSGLDTALASKEPTITAGTTSQYYRGDKSWQTFDKAAVGLSNVDNTADADKPISSAAQTALDGKESTANKGQPDGYASLDSGGKVPVAQLPNSIMEYQGTWNPSTNTPTLADGTGSPGDVYRVSATANRNLGSGSISFTTGDYVIYNGSTWEKSDTTDAVSTVNGYSGNIVLTASDIGLGSIDNTADAVKNVLSATKLTTARNINGVSFDGTANITIADSTKEPAITAGDASQYWRGDKSWQLLNTSVVTEGTNKYYTDARADGRIAAAIGVSVQAYDSDLAAFAGKTAPTGDVVGTTDTQTLSAKTLINPTINSYTEGVVALGTVTAAAIIDISAGTVVTATLTASTTCIFGMPTAVAGKSFTVMVKQAASTGGGGATFTGVKWGPSGAPTMTAAAGKMDIFTFFSDGANWYGSAAQGYTP